MVERCFSCQNEFIRLVASLNARVFACTKKEDLVVIRLDNMMVYSSEPEMYRDSAASRPATSGKLYLFKYIIIIEYSVGLGAGLLRKFVQKRIHSLVLVQCL